MKKVVAFAALLIIIISAPVFARDAINIAITQQPNTPYFIGVPELNIDSEEFTTVILKIKSNKSGTARLFWASSYDPQMNEPKSISFSLDKGNQEYVFNVKAQNPNWVGFIPQILIYPKGGPEGVEIELSKAVLGNLITDIKSGWREFWFFEAPQLRTVNFIYGPKINGISVNAYIYWLVILLSAGLASYAYYKKLPWQTTARNSMIIVLFFWIALDCRILLDQAKAVAIDFQTFYGKSLDEKRGLTTLGNFYNFIKFAGSKLPEGSGFNLLYPPNYYYLEKANYYLYPTHYDKTAKYVLVYDPNRTLNEQAGDYLKKGFKLFAALKEGEYILKND